ncbi:asparagine synthase (glutamine-hydrolyzing) [Pseudactinotalea terrae]|uniref:asparagine synthase (glutamine-hydrolyzing) n=1 Tax=Pseudactinotalea terrae TaxID=1743262 RepID=UPI0012E30622|nr:asparagine synthase (glutamine-hydrolyzing) [Pseudactinotalea terrae]
MCGICGVLSFDGPPDRELVLRMMGRLHHRGPDGSGYYRDHRVALGHTRLSIIDVGGGAQPMSNAQGSVWVTFNGEIFNYVELRDELVALGYRFRTASDTEVIVHAWEAWGEKAFTRFNGQWAIALWDSSAERLVLSRDRLGVRPLYLTQHRDRLLFASEVKCLFADPETSRGFDAEGLAQTFTFWSTVAPATVFAGVEQVEPGTCVVIDAGGRRTARYWAPDFPARGEEPGQDLQENAERLRELLVEAARLRFLRSDVPVGAYLSGGIDSAITASMVARYTDSPLHTFSLRFADADFDEGSYQAEMVSRLGAQHSDVVVDAADIAGVFPEVVQHAEVPILRSAPAPLFLLSKLVRDSGYKVVVTGEGADEVLAGYDIFREARLRSFWARNPRSAVRDRGVELLYPWLSRSPGQAPAFARQFFGRNLDTADPAQSHRPRWDSSAALLTMLAPTWRAATEVDVAARLVDRMPATQASWDPLSRAQWLEMTTLLSGYILASQGDRMLMANSVEGRFPFLDHRVVEFANAVPSRHKLLGMDEKHLLKRAFADLIPASILKRPKQPYRAPDAASFFTASRPEWVDEMLSESTTRAAGVFEPSIVTALAQKCSRTGGARMSNTDNMRVLAVLSTHLVHHQFIASGAAMSDLSPAEPMTIIDRVATPQEA